MTLNDTFRDLDRLKKKQPTLKEHWRQSLSEGLREIPGGKKADMALGQYVHDPIGFCREILNIQVLTPGQIELLEAVRDNEDVTVQSATGVGKTFILAAISIWVYKTQRETKIYTAAAPPEDNLRDLLWGEIVAHTQERPQLFEDDSIKTLRIGRHPKQFIKGVTIPTSAKDELIETRFSGKHAPVLVFICDEGDAIPDPVYKGIDGCMSGGTFMRQVTCLNPKLKEGEVWRKINRGLTKVVVMSAFDHPNVVEGKDVVPGAVTREVTVRRINEWCEWIPPEAEEELEAEEKKFELPGFLVDEVAYSRNGTPYPPLQPGYYRVVEPSFWYKVLGLYPPAGASQLIRDEWITDAVVRWEAMRIGNNGLVQPPAGIQPILGQDVADDGPDFHTCCARYGHWWDVPESWRFADPDMAAMRGATRYKERDAQHIYVDTTGVGAGVPQRMERFGKSELSWKIKATPVKVNEKSLGWSEHGEFTALRDEAYWQIREAFREGSVYLPPDTYDEHCKRLHEALRMLTYETRGGKVKIMDKKTMRRKLGYSPDELEGFMLTYVQGNTWLGGI